MLAQQGACSPPSNINLQVTTLEIWANPYGGTNFIGLPCVFIDSLHNEQSEPYKQTSYDLAFLDNPTCTGSYAGSVTINRYACFYLVHRVGS